MSLVGFSTFLTKYRKIQFEAALETSKGRTRACDRERHPAAVADSEDLQGLCSVGFQCQQECNTSFEVYSESIQEPLLRVKVQ